MSLRFPLGIPKSSIITVENLASLLHKITEQIQNMYIFSMSKKKKGFHVSAEIFEKQWHICLSVKVHCSPACHWGWGAGNTWAFHKGCLPGSQTCPIALNGECGRLGGSWDSSGHHAPPRGQSCARPLGRGQNQAQ